MLLLALLACDDGGAKAGAYALGFGGPPSCVDLPMDAAAPSSFTAELWLRGDPDPADRTLPLMSWLGVFSLRQDSSDMLVLAIGEAGGGATYAFPVADGTLRHVAATFEMGEARIWLDGEQVAFGDAVASTEAGDSVRVGCDPDGDGFEGLLDEVRISGGARYTADFDRPTRPFEVDADTIVLLHFDEGSGTTTKDAAHDREATASEIEWVPFSLEDEAE